MIFIYDITNESIFSVAKKKIFDFGNQRVVNLNFRKNVLNFFFGKCNFTIVFVAAAVYDFQFSLI